MMQHMNTTVRIQGTLSSANPAAVQGNTPRAITNALSYSSLRTFINEKLWNKGIIEFNSNNLPFSGRNIGLGIISMLNDFIKAEGVAELGLEGKLMILVDSSTGPKVFRVTIEDSILRHQQATLTWEPELVS